jgi:hypothetical protein
MVHTVYLFHFDCFRHYSPVYFSRSLSLLGGCRKLKLVRVCRRYLRMHGNCAWQVLRVAAEDKGAGAKESITISNDQNRLTPEDIERMIHEADKYAAEDNAAAEVMAARNELEGYLYGRYSNKRWNWPGGVETPSCDCSCAAALGR